MKKLLSFIFFFTSILSFSQNVQVDSQTYTPQQLIEDILIDSNCITNVTVTNVVGGNFNGTDQSYGYFDATGTEFPFQNGLVLSTGRLSNVPGPNTYISSDTAPNWEGNDNDDDDLETILGEYNTHNTTLIEFEFESIANEISFRYLFASEEYQENDESNCQYSDLFVFLIRKVTIPSTQYENIALVPNTNTPVKVTTVHPNIPGECGPINEEYFGSWNGQNAPINFNGQTAILTATATELEANATYHVKLVIADHINPLYDSAVFLEAGSFRLGTDLGPNRLLATNNPLCENDTLELDAQTPGNNTYSWFQDGIEITNETGTTYTVTEAGVYNVEITLENNCVSYGEITVEYSRNPEVNNTTLVNCDANQDGLTVYNLFDASQDIITTQEDTITDFFTDQNNAIQNIGSITNPNAFENTQAQQIVFARVENRFGCFSIAEILLDISNAILNIPDFNTCDDNIQDGITEFDLNAVAATIQPLVPAGSNSVFYRNENDAYINQNPVNTPFTNGNPYSEILYVKVTNNSQCYSVSSVVLNVLDTPELLPDEDVLYCLNNFPNTINLDAGIINDSPNNYDYIWLKDGVNLQMNTSQISVNETGSYQVTATNSVGCSASRTITVLPSNIATIESVSVVEASTNNSITITVSGEGDYEYALGNSIFQNSNTFTNLSPGFYTVIVRDKNGCGTVTEEVSVLGFPKFFTPNHDGDNDFWKPLGVSPENRTLKIQIFNRYGKLIKELNVSDKGWNGTLNGQNLGSDDYWYHAILPSGKEYFGHFALVR